MSVDKNNVDITIQWSKDPSDVKDSFLTVDRRAPVEVDTHDKAKRNINVYKIIQWLHSQNEINIPYTLAENNCKRFATRLFNRFSN